MRRHAIILLALAALLPGEARAAGSAGASPFNFLFLDADARPVAMGGAYTALANDANALHYNPAGLGRIRRSEATFMHNEYFEGITQEYIGFASRHGYGANLNILRAGDIDRTTVSNPNGTGLGSANFSDLAFGLGYGRALTEHLAAGLGVALHAGPAVRDAANACIDRADLTALLYLQGYRKSEFVTAAAADT